MDIFINKTYTDDLEMTSFFVSAYYNCTELWRLDEMNRKYLVDMNAMLFLHPTLDDTILSNIPANNL